MLFNLNFVSDWKYYLIEYAFNIIWWYISIKLVNFIYCMHASDYVSMYACLWVWRMLVWYICTYICRCATCMHMWRRDWVSCSITTNHSPLRKNFLLKMETGSLPATLLSSLLRSGRNTDECEHTYHFFYVLMEHVLFSYLFQDNNFWNIFQFLFFILIFIIFFTSQLLFTFLTLPIHSPSPLFPPPIHSSYVSSTSSNKTWHNQLL